MSTKDLNRFLEAQQNSYTTALAEIKSGQKTGHWMWYIFPQLKGLGFTPTSDFYGVNSLEEAKDYMKHPILGARLMEISEALLELETSDAQQVMGSPDHIKLRSSMTLFASLPGSDPVFEKILEKYFCGEKDEKTLTMMGKKKFE